MCKKSCLPSSVLTDQRMHIYIRIHNTHAPSFTGPVLVRGMARFLEMKELGRQKVQEQKEREDQVFWKDRSLLNQSSGAQNKSYTKPEPFNLSCFQQSPGEKSRAKKALIEKVRAEIDRECTFQPKTWRRQQKNLINQILADEDEEVGGGKNRGYNYDGNADMDNSVGYSGVNHDNNNSMLNGSRKGTGAVNGNEDDMDPFAANDASLNDESVMNVNLDTFDDLMIDDFDETELNDTNFDAHFSALTQGTNTNEADMSTNTTALNAHTGVGAGVNTSNMEAFLDDFEQMGLDEFGIPTLGTQ